MYSVFSLLEPKKLMGLANLSLNIDGFGQTHANPTTDKWPLPRTHSSDGCKTLQLSFRVTLILHARYFTLLYM